MAISFRTVAQWEKEYFFVDAVAAADILNGEIGTVADGVFTADEDGTSIVMQVEVGDNAGLADYPIKKNEHVRTLDLTKVVGQELVITGYPIPATATVGTVVGKLKVVKALGNGAFVAAVQA